MQSITSAELLFDEARRRGLAPRWLNDYGLFMVELGGRPVYFSNSMSTFNTQMSAYLAGNKYMARSVLAEAGLPNIPYTVCFDETGMQAFLKKHGKIIAKPISGRNSRAQLIDTPAALRSLNPDRLIFEKYIDGDEWRYLVLDGEVLAAHRKEFINIDMNSDAQTRHSYPSSEWDGEMVEVSIKAAAALNLSFGAVDFLRDKTGRSWILEVNSNPGLKFFQKPSTGPGIDIAGLFLERTLQVLGSPIKK